MDVAVLHYHLGRGGVTRVIANHLQALAAACPEGEQLRALALHGGRRGGWPTDFAIPPGIGSVDTVEVPGLDYQGDKTPPPRELSNRILDVLKAHRFQPDQSVLHIHNHSLGKNRSLIPSVRLLAQAGYACLLQIHDFAEDFRPSSYAALRRDFGEQLGSLLYPQSERIHYAVLNSRDENVLRDAGVERLHLLPNPVFEIGTPADSAEARKTLHRRFGVPLDRRFVLYPVRAIRRKNVGEMLFWSAICEQAWFGVSLPTVNPVELDAYRQWKTFAAEKKLPASFELGCEGGLGFEENLAAADKVITTSLAEGFGMAYLETWLAERSLIGRDLPEITADFVNAGVDLSQLKPQLRIPAAWLDRNSLRVRMETAYAAVAEAYGVPADKPQLESLSQKLAGPFVDFGDLDEAAQSQAISLAVQDEGKRREIRHANPWLPESVTNVADGEVIAGNCQAIRSKFGQAAIGARLWEIYSQLRDAPPSGAIRSIDPGRVLGAFLAPHRFRLLRT